MSGRKLGGGRVLGSGRGLAPPTPPITNAPRVASPLAASESSISIASSSISPPVSGISPDLPSQDIGNSISVGAQGKGPADGALVCPICNEEMMTLLQLNRHIDDNHQELPEEEQDEVKTWFDKQVLKAKRFQPLSLINQKLRGLDVFESNESLPVSAPSSAAGKNPLEGPVDPDELITRHHWQRSTSYDLSNPPEKLTQSNGSLLGPVTSLAGQKNPRKLIEQSVVTWEEDFGRLEGTIAVYVVASSVEIRKQDVLLKLVLMCRAKLMVQQKRLRGPKSPSSLQHKPADQRAYETLRQFERGIQQLLPSFHRALLNLQPEKKESGEIDLNKPPPTHAQIQEAAKIRKRLVDSFGKYGIAAKRLRDLPTESPTQRRLQMAIYTYASGFLHTNMLPLKSLPQLLRSRSSASSSTAVSTSRLLASHHHSGSSLRHSELADETSSQAPSEGSTVVSQLEAEEKELRERLVVLEEQRFMVEAMVKTAQGSRRFEEVSALSRNVDELDAEIKVLRNKVGGVEERWEGVYRNGVA
ncbi:Vacuolar segregation protein PEP7 [Fusarium oxysporum f. sp. cubense race 1]|uniref:Vacuolar segregation protein PEP7 n=1 Tax=Fusarium oxysporum f. sp. cubense (strain race 1) TaxID=1229664 RepID=N4UHE4_FUSC1|nr:Vacuolar segregation protein PEP7 [Fusarium oxysporum f. sp. cubense race 1]